MPMGATCTIVLSQKQTAEIESKIMSKATTLYSGYGAKGYFGQIRLVSKYFYFVCLPLMFRLTMIGSLACSYPSSHLNSVVWEREKMFLQTQCVRIALRGCSNQALQNIFTFIASFGILNQISMTF